MITNNWLEKMFFSKVSSEIWNVKARANYSNFRRKSRNICVWGDFFGQISTFKLAILGGFFKSHLKSIDVLSSNLKK